MVQHFISNITNTDLFNKQPNISLNGIFDYYDTKEILINYDNSNSIDNSNENLNDNFEIIDNLTEEEEKDKADFIKTLEEEEVRVKKIIEYLIINLDFTNNKIFVPHYKIYDYSNTPNYLKKKINNNHPFDLKKFLIKNGVGKGELTPIIETMINKKASDLQLTEMKVMTFFILSKILEIYNAYNKSILYSKAILQENPQIIKNKEALVSLNPNIMKIDINANNKIEIFHLNTIKNAFSKITNNTKKATSVSINSSTTIIIEKNSNKGFDINFK